MSDTSGPSEPADPQSDSPSPSLSAPAPLPGYELMQQLTVYITETDHYGHKPLFLAILELAKQYNLAGATVLKGLAGYSASSRSIQTPSFADLQQKLPLVILIVDAASRLEPIVPQIEAMVSPNGGLITIQDLAAHRYFHPSLPGVQPHHK